MFNRDFKIMISNQLIQKLDEAISYLESCPNCDKTDFIQHLRDEICLFDSAGYLYNNYLKPLVSRQSADIINKLETIKKKYENKGHPFFNKWN